MYKNQDVYLNVCVFYYMQLYLNNNNGNKFNYAITTTVINLSLGNPAILLVPLPNVWYRIPASAVLELYRLSLPLGIRHNVPRPTGPAIYSSIFSPNMATRDSCCDFLALGISEQVYLTAPCPHSNKHVPFIQYFLDGNIMYNSYHGIFQITITLYVSPLYFSLSPLSIFFEDTPIFKVL